MSATNSHRCLVLACLLLVGCYPQPPGDEAVKAAASACERAGGTFKYFHGGTIIMECKK